MPPSTASERFPIVPAKTALLFFDTLNVGLHPKDPADQKRLDDLGILPKLVAANAAFRKVGCTICYAQADHRPDHRDAAPLVLGVMRDGTRRDHIDGPRKSFSGTWEAQIAPELEPRPEDYVIKKKRWSAFFQTNLELSLRNAGIDTLVLAGGATEIGIASTAYAARDLDYHQIFLRDAIFSARPEIDKMFLDEIFPRLGRVMTLEQATANFAT